MSIEEPLSNAQEKSEVEVPPREVDRGHQSESRKMDPSSIVRRIFEKLGLKENAVLRKKARTRRLSFISFLVDRFYASDFAKFFSDLHHNREYILAREFSAYFDKKSATLANTAVSDYQKEVQSIFERNGLPAFFDSHASISSLKRLEGHLVLRANEKQKVFKSLYSQLTPTEKQIVEHQFSQSGFQSPRHGFWITCLQQIRNTQPDFLQKLKTKASTTLRLMWLSESPLLQQCEEVRQFMSDSNMSANSNSELQEVVIFDTFDPAKAKIFQPNLKTYVVKHALSQIFNLPLRKRKSFATTTKGQTLPAIFPSLTTNLQKARVLEEDFICDASPEETIKTLQSLFEAKRVYVGKHFSETMTVEVPVTLTSYTTCNCKVCK